LQLQINNIGKRYQKQWLFRNINLELKLGDNLSVTGHNGSGKSTFIQVVYGLVQASEGEVLLNGNSNYKPHEVFALSAPYLELPMEFNLIEIHDLYQRTQKMNANLDEFLAFSDFSKIQAQRAVKLFSSGMQQRLKTALCLSSNSPVLLLDEPLSNMDTKGEDWYKNCLNDINNKIVIIAGNNPIEYAFTNTNLQIKSA
jgi:ABC-type multidrug transport system ATPase subunit